MKIFLNENGQSSSDTLYCKVNTFFQLADWWRALVAQASSPATVSPSLRLGEPFLTTDTNPKGWRHICKQDACSTKP